LTYGHFSIFQDVGRPSSWICFTCAWDHRQSVVGSGAKLGFDWKCSFEDIQISTFVKRV